MNHLKLLSQTTGSNKSGSNRRNYSFLMQRIMKFINRYKVLLGLGILGVSFILFLILGRGGSADFNLAFGKPPVAIDSDKRVNVLLLGIAGGRHDGALLTDTVLVASYDTKTKTADLISLPRDLWIEEHQSKINTLYQTGLGKNGNEDRGLKFAEKEVGKLLGISIPYAIRVNFQGFVDAVDQVGGIEVNIPKTFDDYNYPIEGKENDLCGYEEKEVEVDEAKSRELNVPIGKQKLYLKDGKESSASAQIFSCRLEHIHFDQGLTLVDGGTALKFVRSRQGTNGEGSDFARSKRQQLVLQAFRQKILSVETLTDVSKMITLLQTFGQSVATDIPQSQFIEFIKMVRNLEKTKSHVIDATGVNPLLINPPSGNYGAWVLIPPNNDFSIIQKFVDETFASSSAEVK